MIIPHNKFESFARAFDARIGSCRGQCACGKEFYEPNGHWDWEDGEIEALENRGAHALEWSIGYVEFEGQTFVRDCTCFHERAKRVIAFLDAHAKGIAEYFKNEKARKLDEAERSVEVEHE